MTEYSGSSFKTPCAKGGARALLNENRTPVLCSRSFDGAINLPASLGHLRNISLAHQACTTHTSKMFREPGLYLAVVGQHLLGYPLACTLLECHGYIPTREPCVDCSGAVCSSGVRINRSGMAQRRNRNSNSKVGISFHLYHISYRETVPLHYPEQVVPGKATGTALAGNGAAGGGQ